MLFFTTADSEIFSALRVDEIPLFVGANNVTASEGFSSVLVKFAIFAKVKRVVKFFISSSSAATVLLDEAREVYDIGMAYVAVAANASSRMK